MNFRMPFFILVVFLSVFSVTAASARAAGPDDEERTTALTPAQPKPAAPKAAGFTAASASSTQASSSRSASSYALPAGTTGARLPAVRETGTTGYSGTAAPARPSSASAAPARPAYQTAAQSRPAESENAETPAPAAPAPAPKPPAPPPPPSFSVDSALKKARDMAADEPLKAREYLEKVLTEEKLSSSQEDRILGVYEEINYGLLLSKDETPETMMYTIKRGDSLYEIAKEHKTTIPLIRKMNNLKGDMIYPDKKLKLIKEPIKIRVDKSENMLYVYLGDKLLKRYRVSTGRDSSTPEGTFKVTTKLTDPVWWHAGAAVPANSPQNILGTRWLGFDKKGYGIHGTTIPESIGKQQTSGCVRMLNEQVEELYDTVPHGTQVTIVA